MLHQRSAAPTKANWRMHLRTRGCGLAVRAQIICVAGALVTGCVSVFPPRPAPKSPSKIFGFNSKRALADVRALNERGKATTVTSVGRS